MDYFEPYYATCFSQKSMNPLENDTLKKILHFCEKTRLDWKIIFNEIQKWVLV